jgi:hypothetical protein
MLASEWSRRWTETFLFLNYISNTTPTNGFTAWKMELVGKTLLICIGIFFAVDALISVSRAHNLSSKPSLTNADALWLHAPVSVYCLTCRFWGSYGCECEDVCLTACSALWSGVSLPGFPRFLLPPFSGASLTTILVLLYCDQPGNCIQLKCIFELFIGYLKCAEENLLQNSHYWNRKEKIVGLKVFRQNFWYVSFHCIQFFRAMFSNHPSPCKRLFYCYLPGLRNFGIYTADSK